MKKLLKAASLCAAALLMVGCFASCTAEEEPGSNAGMAGAGACWGFRGEEELRAAGADYLLNLPLDLLRE